jgi:hypothetical protein
MGRAEQITELTAETRYAQAVMLCCNALRDSANDDNEGHAAVLALLPRGLYRSHEGEIVLLDAVVRMNIPCRYLGSMDRYMARYYRLEEMKRGVWRFNSDFGCRPLVGKERGWERGWFTPTQDNQHRFVPINP